MDDRLIMVKIRLDTDEIVRVDGKRTTAFMQTSYLPHGQKLKLIVKMGECQAAAEFRQLLPLECMTPIRQGQTVEAYAGDYDDLVFVFRHCGLRLEAPSCFGIFQGILRQIGTCEPSHWNIPDLSQDEIDAEGFAYA